MPASSPPSRGSPRSTAPLPAARTSVSWGRLALTLCLIPLSFRAYRGEEGYIPLLSDIDVAVHETGHYLFAPFGETMHIFGGSFFQVVFPLVFAGYFLFGKKEHRDLHAAMVCVWWSAVNMVEVGVYMADARARELTLLSGATGWEDDGHDWYNLLAKWGRLDWDTIYAGRLNVFAALVFMTSICVGFWAAARMPSKEGSESAPGAA